MGAKRPTIYCAVTGHGFGHGVRMACVVAEIQRLRPDCLVILATRAPRWLLESYIPGDFIHRPVSLDAGVIQSDSLQMDLDATRRELTAVYQGKNALIAQEADYLRQNQADLVLADIPALAVSLAHQAGIPAWLMGNFGWNFIYRDWGPSFWDLAEQIEADYQACDQLFRLPLAEPMTIFPRRRDVGLTGGAPRYSEAELREKLALKTPPERTVLLTFGGLGLASIPYETLAKFPDWLFLTFDAQAPKLPNLISLPPGSFRPVDVMPLCGRVISKPGYSTFAEALRLGVPLVSLTREGFAEAPILLAGLQDYGRHQIIDTADFFLGRWHFLKEEPSPPRLTEKLDPNGAETIAQAVAEFLP
jgi:hypothetical protein